jgi:hypothetical protein
LAWLGLYTKRPLELGERFLFKYAFNKGAIDSTYAEAYNEAGRSLRGVA